MRRFPLRMFACRLRICCWAKGADSKSRRGGWGPGEFIIACAASAWPSAPWKRCASACRRGWHSEKRWLNKAARSEIAMIKVVAPNVTLRVLDRAIQAHGGAGVSQDTFLASAWANVRTLRLADGPDEVHTESIAKWELGKCSKPRAHSASH